MLRALKHSLENRAKEITPPGLREERTRAKQDPRLLSASRSAVRHAVSKLRRSTALLLKDALHCTATEHAQSSGQAGHPQTPRDRGAGTGGWEITLFTCTCTSWKMALSTDTASPGGSTSHMLWGQDKKSKN